MAEAASTPAAAARPEKRRFDGIQPLPLAIARNGRVFIRVSVSRGCPRVPPCNFGNFATPLMFHRAERVSAEGQGCRQKEPRRDCGPAGRDSIGTGRALRRADDVDEGA
jgi:hypothetical protein